MTTHNLEENPNLFIAPKLYDDKFVYRMFHLSEDENEVLVHIIDLRSDKLMIYGTEINESMLERLHQSLTLKQSMGGIRVNCCGACYFVVAGKGRCTPLHNVIFDWSPFGVTVPNSINDSLKKTLKQKEKEIDEVKDQLSSAEAEASSAKAALEASKKEMEELKEQLSACKRDRNDMEEKMQKVCTQLSLIDSELESKKEMEELKEQLAACKRDRNDMEEKMQKVCTQLSLIDSELESKKIELESCKKELKLSWDQLSAYTQKSRLSSANSELQLTTTQLELSRARVMELEEQLSTYKKERQNMELELEKLQGQLSVVNSELQLTKTQLEYEDQLAFRRKESLAKQAELRKAQDELSSIRLELYSTKSQLESSKERVKELEEQLSASKEESEEMAELRKALNQLSLVVNDLQFTKSLLESSVKMLQELKEQLFTLKREDIHGEAELEKLSHHLSSVDTEVKSTRQKLEEMLIELNRGRPSQSRIQCPWVADTTLQGMSSGHSLLPTEVSIAIEEDIYMYK